MIRKSGKNGKNDHLHPSLVYWNTKGTLLELTNVWINSIKFSRCVLYKLVIGFQEVGNDIFVFLSHS